MSVNSLPNYGNHPKSKEFCKIVWIEFVQSAMYLVWNSDYFNKDVKAETDDFFNTNKIWNLYIVREFHTNIHVF